ncbi:MAG TPA: peptide-methionine (S)-S-oxide reductase MsrA [bacterium]|nr:peptide-methionine (S)-S-oxide reductase MsrA [bacterium]
MTDHVNLKLATFAGGCFWCMEGPFEALKGVTQVIAGYAGGHKQNPTYEEVRSGETGHLEVIQVTYDPGVVSYEHLLQVYWRQIDPTDDCGQFHDRGVQYQTAIFFHDEEQKHQAEQTKQALEREHIFSKPIVTQILPYSNFFCAEEYHQHYYRKNPQQYEAEVHTSGRKSFLQKIWPKKTTGHGKW